MKRATFVSRQELVVRFPSSIRYNFAPLTTSTSSDDVGPLPAGSNRGEGSIPARGGMIDRRVHRVFREKGRFASACTRRVMCIASAYHTSSTVTREALKLFPFFGLRLNYGSPKPKVYNTVVRISLGTVCW